jgi:cysteine desulfurase
MTGESPSLYFDYAATTPVAPEVAAAMCDCLTARPLLGNPSSDHAPGRRAAARVEAARAAVAEFIGADASEIVWTSGATEADNLAVIGAARQQRARGRGHHVITVATEHRAVLAAAERLEADGFRVTRLPVASDGTLDPEAVDAALEPETVLVSVMHVNNETGVVQDIRSIGERVRARGALFHVDAAQSVGRLPLDVRDLPVDLVSLSAHKLYGPAGVGALYVRARPRVRLQPLVVGGGQEQGRRGGTLAVHQLVGIGEAFRLAGLRRQQDLEHLQQLRARLLRGLARIDGLVLNGRADGAPHIVNVAVPGVHGAALRAELDGIAYSAGSACASRQARPSHVLRAMGVPDALAAAALRLSLGRETGERDVDHLVQRLAAAVERLRALSPVWRELEQGRSLESIYGDRAIREPVA